MPALIEDGPHCSLDTPLHNPRESTSWRYRLEQRKGQKRVWGRTGYGQTPLSIQVYYYCVLSPNHEDFLKVLCQSGVNTRYSSIPTAYGKLVKTISCPVRPSTSWRCFLSASTVRAWGKLSTSLAPPGSGCRSFLPLNSPTHLIVFHFPVSHSPDSRLRRGHGVLPSGTLISRPS